MGVTICTRKNSENFDSKTNGTYNFETCRVLLFSPPENRTLKTYDIPIQLQIHAWNKICKYLHASPVSVDWKSLSHYLTTFTLTGFFM